MASFSGEYVRFHDRLGVAVRLVIGAAQYPQEGVVLFQVQDGLHRKQDKLRIHPDSQQYLELSEDRILKLKEFGIIRVFRKPEYSSIEEYVANEYAANSNIQAGDILILGEEASTRFWLHKGQNSGTADDFFGFTPPSLEEGRVPGALALSDGLAWEEGLLTLKPDDRTLTISSDRLKVADGSIDSNQLHPDILDRIANAASLDLFNNLVSTFTQTELTARSGTQTFLYNHFGVRAEEVLEIGKTEAPSIVSQVIVRVIQGFMSSNPTDRPEIEIRTEAGQVLVHRASEKIDWITPGTYIIPLLDEVPQPQAFLLETWGFSPGEALVTVVYHPQPTQISPPPMCSDRELQLALGERGIASIEELAEIQILNDLHDRNISSIDCLQPAVSLQVLSLGQNAISDLSPLAGMAELKELDLQDNQIADLTSLSQLHSVETLNVRGNQISDLSPLLSLTKLETLDVSKNPLDDISQLLPVTSLKRLKASISRLSTCPVQSLINLTELSVSWNEISDLSPISSLVNLEILRATKNKIAQLPDLSPLQNLKILDIQKNTISDINPISGLSNLEVLKLDDNSVSDISGLSNLPKLRYISLEENPVSDISGLIKFASTLSVIDIRGTQVVDISLFNSWSIWFSLVVRRTKITDLSPLSGKKIGKLNIEYSDVGDLEPLAGNPYLKHLYALGSQVTDLSPLFSCPNLTLVRISEGQVSDSDIQTLRDNGAIVEILPVM